MEFLYQLIGIYFIQKIDLPKWAIGYGQSNPVNSNDTAEDSTSNRRTEFEIIEN